jgi:RimJ/RimL family protein N-acetyltransferase
VSFALRPWNDGDVDDVVRLTADPEIVRWTRIPDPNTPDMVREFMASAPEGERHMAIVDEVSGELLGAVGLQRLHPEGHRGEIGYWVAGEHRGRGIASRAVDRLAQEVFAARPLRRLELHVHPDNAASRRVAEKAGFIFEGVLRSYVTIEGRPEDVAMYARIAE